MVPCIIIETDDLAREALASAVTVQWLIVDDSALALRGLNVYGEIEQDILAGIETATPKLLSTFDLVKSLHRPLDIIPATLHPADQTA